MLDSALEEGSPQETMVGRRGGREFLGNRAKLNILCPLWRREEDKCACVCVCERDRTLLKSFVEEGREIIGNEKQEKETYAMGAHSTFKGLKVCVGKQLVRTRI